jgi:predicted lysophospholipase L1 biosynthesis ABC-type transport system permease subunit
VTEPTAPAGDEPKKDPNYILSQSEFHAAMREQAERENAGVRLGLSQLNRNVDGLVSTAGWVAVSLAFWLLLVGYSAIRGELRGRP